MENNLVIRVAIADDHKMVAEGIARLIEESETAHVVGIAGTLGDAASLISAEQPDVLLLDVALPDGDGIDSIPQFLAASSQTRVVVLTMFGERAVIARALEAGASGFVLKSAAPEVLMEAMRAVCRDEVYLCGESSRIQRISKEVAPTLTPREREILRLIVDGLSIKEIADRLCLGFETVHSYTKYLRRKLQANNMASLVRTAIEQHLV